MSDRIESRLPGDYTVRSVPGGWVLGKVLPPSPRGVGWVYVNVVATEEEAIREAKRLASDDGTRVWRQEDGNTFTRLI